MIFFYYYTTMSDLYVACMFAQLFPGLKQSFTYLAQKNIIHTQIQNSINRAACGGFGLYHGLVNYTDTKVKCHHQKLTCKGLCGSAYRSL
jgi:hypothetical protein